MGFWPVVMNVLRNSDVVLLLVDARMPDITQNSEIVEKVKATSDKRLIFVFNKSDLISRKDIEKLKDEYPNAFFISATKKIGVGKLRATLKNMADNWHRPSLRVGLVGYPNIGKSTLINLLAPEAKAKVSPVSGTTKKTQWVRTGRLRIMDSPGVIPYGDKKVQIGMTASKDPHKIRNPEKVAIKIIEFIMEKNPKVLEKMYGAKGEDAYEVFEEIARKKGFLIKGGETDENRTAIKVIDDWQKGKTNLK
ncbi:MAG: 50S ribosome-binding GTPase [Nanoarchaeota archaeon]|nr:50S ribosome-binding GTPase [Nanoarchaeota archaeon]